MFVDKFSMGYITSPTKPRQDTPSFCGKSYI